ncbi:hypothetical protein BaRGS_00007217 [Batillaria attramentaria]|uniref:Uncharacterized protein n=1 Tax=Batillaria attramentaria TaxID=370345 RepID=A0ABD0LPK3_9CAEN
MTSLRLEKEIPTKNFHTPHPILEVHEQKALGGVEVSEGKCSLHIHGREQSSEETRHHATPLVPGSETSATKKTSIFHGLAPPSGEIIQDSAREQSGLSDREGRKSPVE